MRTPAQAVLWESWRLSRVPLVLLMLGATLGGAALIVTPLEGDWGTMHALLLTIVLAWISQSRWATNVDRRRGFALWLGFTRPIRTWVLVVVPIAYVGVSSALVYLVPAMILRTVFDIPFPLLPVAALVAALSVMTVASQWWTGNAVFRRALPMVLLAPGLLWYWSNLNARTDLPPQRWPEIFAFSAGSYALLALVVAAAVAVTVRGVAWQRHGNDEVTFARAATGHVDAHPNPTLGGWLADRLRVPCPVSSPTRAQLWLEVRTVGAPCSRPGSSSHSRRRPCSRS